MHMTCLCKLSRSKELVDDLARCSKTAEVRADGLSKWRLGGANKEWRHLLQVTPVVSAWSQCTKNQAASESLNSVHDPDPALEQTASSSFDAWFRSLLHSHAPTRTMCFHVGIDCHGLWLLAIIRLRETRSACHRLEGAHHCPCTCATGGHRMRRQEGPQRMPCMGMACVC